jgi:hypothetical protein
LLPIIFFFSLFFTYFLCCPIIFLTKNEESYS